MGADSLSDPEQPHLSQGHSYKVEDGGSAVSAPLLGW